MAQGLLVMRGDLQDQQQHQSVPNMLGNGLSSHPAVVNKSFKKGARKA